MSETIVILMATYNGECFLQEQIESIKKQSYHDWELWIRDDGSSDKTIEIIHQALLCDQRIKLINDNNESRGAKENFSILMKHALKSNYQYFCFADQDDYWLEKKLSIQFEVLKSAIDEASMNIPFLVYSDLMVVDEQLNTIANSGMKHHKMYHPVNDFLGVLLARNVVTGCTVLFNQALLKTAYPVPKQSLMHDWWLALCAATYGKVIFVKEPLVLYRQHAKNVVGAAGFYKLINPFKASWKKNWQKGTFFLCSSFEQAKALIAVKAPFETDKDSYERIKNYSSLLHLSRLNRLLMIYRLKVHRQTFLLNLLFYMRLCIL